MLFPLFAIVNRAANDISLQILFEHLFSINLVHIRSGINRSHGNFVIRTYFGDFLGVVVQCMRICLHCRRPGVNPRVRKVPWRR